jgi:hypothetical protein
MNAQQLANEFLDIVRMWLPVEELEAIDKANAVDDSCCASHEYCDPNQAMIEALDKFGVEYDGQDEEQGKLIDDAWSIAKKIGFSVSPAEKERRNVLRALVAYDPNGVYLDADCDCEGISRLSLGDAKAKLEEIVNRE